MTRDSTWLYASDFSAIKMATQMTPGFSLAHKTNLHPEACSIVKIPELQVKLKQSLGPESEKKNMRR